eukprot:scaffold215490_cov35-Tisochrysis_lutea.AAC.2
MGQTPALRSRPRSGALSSSAASTIFSAPSTVDLALLWSKVTRASRAEAASESARTYRIASSPLARSRAQRMTAKPRCARNAAASRPIPSEAPVTAMEHPSASARPSRSRSTAYASLSAAAIAPPIDGARASPEHKAVATSIADISVKPTESSERASESEASDFTQRNLF